MELFQLEAKIAEHIVLAQITSDFGKGMLSEFNFYPKIYRKVRRRFFNIKSKYGIGAARSDAYDQKDEHIERAMQLINVYHRKGGKNFHYVVSEDKDWIADYVLYFNLNFGEFKNRQVSFHSFNDHLQKYVTKNTTTHWDHEYGSSRNSCEDLLCYYCI